MARTAPVPNLPPIPGMCPSIAVMGGGGDSGGGGGSGAGSGDGSAGGDGSGDGANGAGDGRNAPGSEACGDPVDVATGRVFMEVQDFGLPGPMPLLFRRNYNSRRSRTDDGLGHGWSHSFSWRLVVDRTEITVFDADGTRRLHPVVSDGSASRNDHGDRLEPRQGGFTLAEVGGDVYRDFATFQQAHVFLLVRVRDRNGNRIEVERDPTGRITALVDSANRRLAVSSDSNGRLRAIEYSGTRLVHFDYDDDGNLISARDALDHARRYGYIQHLLTSHELKDGLTYFWRYAGQGHDARCIETWGEYPGRIDVALAQPIHSAPPGGPDRRAVKGIFHYRFDYQADQNYTEVTDARGGVTRYESNEKSLVWKKVDPRGGVTTRTYDRSGALLSETYPNGRRVQWRRSSSGRVSDVADPSGAPITFNCDHEDRTISRSDPNGATHTYDRDTNGNIVQVDFPDGMVESYVYDARGLVTRFVERNGATWLLEYDHEGNAIRRTHPDGGCTTVAYDAFGRWLGVVDPEGHQTRYEYDLRGELQKITFPDGQTEHLQYDPEGRIVLREQPGGRIDRLEYGGHGWLTAHIDPVGRMARHHYDPLGFPTRATAPDGEVYETDYDLQGNAIEMRTFDGRRIQHRYDNARRRTRTKLPSRAAYLMEYDSWDRQTAFDASDGTAISSKWSTSGALVSSSAGEFECEYDSLGRLVQETTSAGTVDRELDACGRVASFRTSNGAEVRFQYDGSGRLLRCQTSKGDLEITRDRRGLPTQHRLATSVVVDSLFDPLERLVATTSANLGQPSAAPMVARTFSYDSFDNVARIEDQSWGTTRYEHDAAWQLTHAADEAPGGRLVRERRFARTGLGSPIELSATGTALHRYEPGGRVVAADGNEYVYDDDGRLIELRPAGGAPISFQWNALGQLVGSQAGNRITRYEYDLLWRRTLKETRQRDGKLVESVRFLWLDDAMVEEVSSLHGSRLHIPDPTSGVPLATVDERGFLLCTTDHNGNIRELIALDGRVIWRGRYGPHGTLDDERGGGQPLRFLGQYFDAETGLHYNRSRYYDPRSGSYIRTDPIGLQGGLNPYLYLANPVNEVDPLGLAPGRSRSKRGPNETAGEFASRIGPHADPNGYIPNYESEEQRFPKAIRDRVDELGEQHGCHTCKKKPGQAGFVPASSGHNFTPDHQPPVKLRAPNSGNFRLYPQCGGCSPRGGGSIRHQPAGSRRGYSS